jgi:hypothetical protein
MRRDVPTDGRDDDALRFPAALRRAVDDSPCSKWDRTTALNRGRFAVAGGVAPNRRYGLSRSTLKPPGSGQRGISGGATA